MITQEYLRKLFYYDEETGVFTRLITRGNNAVRGRIAGSPDANGYLQITLDKKNYKAHRLAWLYVYGEFPNGVIDHINGVPSDNRISNLRDVDPKVNWENQRGPRIDNKLGYLGVCPYHGKFKASIGIGGSCKHIGYYDTPEEAYQAYIEAKRKYHAGCTI